MKVRLFAVAALVLTLAVAASSASARTNVSGRAAASKITVWLQVDAQSADGQAARGFGREVDRCVHGRGGRVLVCVHAA